MVSLIHTVNGYNKEIGDNEMTGADMNGTGGVGILQAIGNTPLIRVEGVYAKLETFNATGSIKDRMAWYMVRKAEERGALKPGAVIVELTSGNTGISLAMIAAIRGYRFTAVMPGNMSAERIQMMRAFGAEVVLTPAEEDMEGACREYDRQVTMNPDAWLPRQFCNPDNVEAHRVGLGMEILWQMEAVGPIDAVVAGIGTGGTLIGAALAIRERFPNARIIGVEPSESAVLNGGPPGSHTIEGIGEGFVPKLVEEHRSLIDEVIAVPSGEAARMSRSLASRNGVLVGVSSGANILAAIEAKKYGTVVTVLADRGERYLSKWGEQG
jgi:cysteine synthase A